MILYVGVTDNQWFTFLAERHPDEVNFWRPGGTGFQALTAGAPFLFKLHSPLNFITGGGFFVRFSRLPLSLAWEAFGQKNGAPDFETLSRQIHHYRQRRGDPRPDPDIGCIILAQPFFFPKDEWIPIPEDWQPGIQQGRTYSTDELVGARLWEQVRIRLTQYDDLFRGTEQEKRPSTAAEPAPRYGSELLVRPRLGQGAFRVTVLEAYQRRCAMTGERTLPVLESVHIKPYAESGPHQVDNGLLLRADLHILFDRGYLTLSNDLRVEVSRRIKEDFENGEHYNALHGHMLAIVPQRGADRPSIEYVQWHNENRFLG